MADAHATLSPHTAVSNTEERCRVTLHFAQPMRGCEFDVTLHFAQPMRGCEFDARCNYLRAELERHFLEKPAGGHSGWNFTERCCRDRFVRLGALTHRRRGGKGID
jgi:hypothetical protein